ncbi:MAG: glyoxalase [Bacteroidetes bacterium]|nr:glyoxalase [Bacteroidota bacterium]
MKAKKQPVKKQNTKKQSVSKQAAKKQSVKKQTPEKQSGKKQGVEKYADRKMNPVVHFEIPTKDRKKLADFFAKAFGWKAMFMGAPHGDYTLVFTGETDKDNMLKEKGIINGGLYRKDDKKPAQYPTIVIAVVDINEAMEKIKKAGGKIIGKPEKIPGYGQSVSFYDVDGNRLSIIEPSMEH